MKKPVPVLIIVTLLVSVVSAQLSYGQSCEKLSFPIKGKYVALCPQKQMSLFSLSYCSLCPNEISEDKKSLFFPIFYMDFSENNLEISMDDKVTPVKFTTGLKFNYIKFRFNKRKYKFRYYYGMGDVDFILKDKTGNLITLKKVE